MKKLLFLLCFKLFTILMLILAANAALIDSKISGVEADVVKLVREVERSFNSRCENSTPKEKCLYQACSPNLPKFECMKMFEPLKCSKCSEQDKGMMLKDVPFVKLANVYEPKADPDNTAVRELTYSGLGLPSLFKSVHNSNPKFYKWMYYGNSAGSFQQYPGEQFCGQYDNRFRPWYIGAATGAKNFIMVLDISGSMQNYGKFEGLIEATKLLLKTLTNADWVGLVTFSTEAKYYNKSLVRATQENIKKIEKYINTLQARGGTNFSEAFKLTDEMIKNTIADENGVPCKTFIMFLTDGIPTEGIKDEAPLITYIDSLTSLKTAILFTYAFGRGAGTSIPSKLACLLKGIFETIVFTADIVEKMNSYFLHLSLGVETLNPVWVEPYDDAMGLGIMTTCALPVYDRTATTPFLIGVIGIDIMMADLYAVSDQKTVKNKLIQKSMQACVKPNISNCELNTVRKDGFTCELTAEEKKKPCKKLKNKITYCGNPIGNVFCNKREVVKEGEEINLCCGGCSTEGGTTIAIIIVVVVLVIILIIVLIILWKKGVICKSQSKEVDDKPNKKKADDVAVAANPAPIGNNQIQHRGSAQIDNNMGAQQGQQIHMEGVQQGSSYPIYPVQPQMGVQGVQQGQAEYHY